MRLYTWRKIFRQVIDTAGMSGITEKGIKFTVYDRDLWRDKGHGTVAIFIKREGRSDEELLALKEEARAKQKLKNEASVLREKAGRESADATALARAEETVRVAKAPRAELEHLPDIELGLDEHTGNTVALLAASKAGKSTILMHLYRKYWAGKDWISCLFSVSGQAPVYQGHPDLIRVCGFPDDGEKLIKLEKLINTKGRKKNKYKFLNMLDDIITAKQSKLLNSLLLVYRNSNMSTCLSLQYPYLMSKQTRANLNHVLLGRFHSEELNGEVVKMFLRAWLSSHGVVGLDAQVNWYKRVTAKNGFVLINNMTGEVSLHRLKL